MFLNNADNIGYDNRASGLEAGNVQVAIDKLANKAYIYLHITESDSSTEYSNKARVPYPEGFNRNSTFFVCGKYQLKNPYDADFDKGYNVLKDVMFGENQIIIPLPEASYTYAFKIWLVIEKDELESFKSNV